MTLKESLEIIQNSLFVIGRSNGKTRLAEAIATLEIIALNGAAAAEECKRQKIIAETFIDESGKSVLIPIYDGLLKILEGNYDNT